jgi:glycosyltransferase involved in cell wall biosynthesis
MKVALSILTPAVPSRFAQLEQLCIGIGNQIGDKPVEHIIFLDNKRRSVGEKRDALLRAARGDYITFVDDDDAVSDDYVDALLDKIGPDPRTDSRYRRPDVITFRQWATINGESGEVEFRLHHPNEPFKPGGITKRNAWHVCAWRREIAICSSFPPINYGEDWAYAQKLCALDGLRTEHISRVLHYYRHDEKLSEAPPMARSMIHA